MEAAVAAGDGETLVLVQARRDFEAGAAASDANTLVAACSAVRDGCVSCRSDAVWVAERSATFVVVLHLLSGWPPSVTRDYDLFVEATVAAWCDASSRELRSLFLIAWHELRRRAPTPDG